MKKLNKLFFCYLFVFILCIGVGLGVLYGTALLRFAAPVNLPDAPPLRRVILIPLDSRPPCTSFVQQIGAMSRIEVILPPTKLLDDYRSPARTEPLFEWAESQLASADAIIVSADMLIHGGLIASRNVAVTAADADRLVTWLQSIKRRQPALRIYAFSIIPRLLIADNPETSQYRFLMAEWSILTETVSLYENPSDIKKQAELEMKLPVWLRSRYQELYQSKTALNLKLIDLTRQGGIDVMVIGQDDSSPFGLGNMARRRIQDVLAKEPSLQDRVLETRGTDEVAITLLSRIISDTGRVPLLAAIEYTTEKTKDLIMPYMPGTIAATVREKLLLTGTRLATSESEADYLLIIHAGAKNESAADRRRTADAIKNRLESGQQIALVDLSEDFSAARTLLPLLKLNGAPLHRLLAYAGWNTTSNSIGTAISQANSVIAARHSPWYLSVGSLIEIRRVEFINERFLDDWAYQKVLRPQVNERIISRHIDPYSLGPYRDDVSARVQQDIRQQHSYWLEWVWRTNAWQIDSPNGSYVPARWSVTSRFPWDRTFEVDVRVRFEPAKIIGDESFPSP